ncbi:hypothetical protein BUALT_Bualt04G0055400 [Buddleja alternifolia]|uniref:CAF17 C-terminal domain-containing protein n=1 Tax=Buddleja alternifolia TaxID=168488 RepID=A0AAV6XMY3_9LAMI|nr:hypothetical protein BUALT_Bualt04G0055400 [Buddleja alternifolia]
MYCLKSPLLQLLKSNSCKLLMTPLQSVVCLLKTRSVIRFKGLETIIFLQGLLTNDVRSLGDPAGENSATPNMPAVTTPPLYAAMLTPQGRFLYDFFLYRPTRFDDMLDLTGSGPRSDPDDLEIYADVDGSVMDELLATLKRYRLRSRVDIENVAEDFSCWQRFGGNLEAKSSPQQESEVDSVRWGGTVDHAGVSASRGNRLGWHWNKDPRLACLGYRGIFPSNATPPLVESDKEEDEGNFLLWRLKKGVAEGSIEIPKEVEQKVAPGSEVIDATSQKKAGTVTTALGSHGLGFLRLDEAFKGTNSLKIKGEEDVYVETIRPECWPSEWFLDHHKESAAA